tara:strand:- start:4938 stop:6467 length:1530 start_codon:yes stop_codon:yes gene_type:complete
MSRVLVQTLGGGGVALAGRRGLPDGRVLPRAVTRVAAISATGIVSVEQFVGVALEALEDVFEPNANPSGFVDLAMLDSRLLDGYDTSGTGLERKAPTSGIELRQCVAQMLVEGGHGAPWVSSSPGVQGWLSPEWVTILGAKSEAEAVESVVAGALAATTMKTGVLVVAPYRPAWPSPSGRLSHPVTSDGSVTAPSVLYVDPSAHGDDINAALDTGAETLRSSSGAEVGAVVLGNPSPATGVVASTGAILEVMRWCQSQDDVHVIADETGACGVYVSRPSSSFPGVAAAVAAGIGPTALTTNPNAKMTDDEDDEPAWGRKAGFMSTSSLWRKANTQLHVVTSFGSAAGISRGKTTCLLVTRDDRVRSGAGSDPFANGLQALMGDGGTAAREAISHHNMLLRRRQKKVRTALDALGVATGPAAAVPTTRADGGGYVWIDLSEFCGGSFEGETRLWEELAITYRVLIVPGGLCGAARPGYFRAAVAGTEEALEKGLERLELGVRAANDTGCG